MSIWISGSRRASKPHCADLLISCQSSGCTAAPGFAFLSVLLLLSFWGKAVAGGRREKATRDVWNQTSQIQLFTCSPPAQTRCVCFISCLDPIDSQPALSLSWLLGRSLQNAACTDSLLTPALLFIYLSVVWVIKKHIRHKWAPRSSVASAALGEEGGKEDWLCACDHRKIDMLTAVHDWLNSTRLPPLSRAEGDCRRQNDSGTLRFSTSPACKRLSQPPHSDSDGAPVF